MQDSIKEMLIKKNQKLIDMVIERAKRDFPDDIALIGLTGSFSTGDFHEKSDLDLIIVNETERGWGIAAGFILDDVGYDIYCTPWEPRIVAQSKLESPMAGILIDLKVLYCAKPEYLEKLNRYRQKALDLLKKPIGKECMDRARKNINLAKQHYADAMLSDQIGAVRYAAGGVLYETVNALTNLNNTYIKRGIKRYLEEILAYKYLPDNMESMYMAVIEAATVEELRNSTQSLLSSLISLYEKMRAQFVDSPSPTYENLWGTYEELWCNCRNKVIASTNVHDFSYAFHAALGAQAYLDEMTGMLGTPHFDLMQHFDTGNLQKFQDAFVQATADYAAVYDQAGRKICRYDSFEHLYEDYMNGRLNKENG
jgi:hypothetical protein